MMLCQNALGPKAVGFNGLDVNGLDVNGLALNGPFSTRSVRIQIRTQWNMTMPVTNAAILGHAFLAEMYADSYFPDVLVDRGKAILLRLCEAIEAEQPTSLEALYALTHAATDEFNALAEDFYEHDSEIETAARDCIGGDFVFIAEAYGFDADSEELIATRDW
jgi:hypothetical protein